MCIRTVCLQQNRHCKERIYLSVKDTILEQKRKKINPLLHSTHKKSIIGGW